MTEVNYIREYRALIDEGKIVAGKWIKAILKILCDGLDSGDYFYNQQLADRAINYIENFCHHSKGRSDRLVLELWEKVIISAIFGIVDGENNRFFREIFIVVARKNGKTLLASAIISYMAFIEEEYGQEIYCLAPKLDQAALVYDAFYRMTLAEPELSELAKKRRSDVYIESANTIIKPIAFNAKKSDGLNPNLAVCDEIAAWQGDAGLKQYEVIKSALGARKQPLIVAISTAGYIDDSIYDELMKRSTAFLLGNSDERRLLPFLFMIDDPEKWNDITELEKSNPNMDVSVSRDFYKEEIAIASQSLSKQREFKTKYCNLKQNSTSAWLPYEVIDRISGEDYSLKDFTDSYCVGGIDLSQTTDLTACGVIIEKNEILYCIFQFFMCAKKIDELQEREGVPYRLYQRQGLITLSGENYVDYNDCFEWYVDLIRKYRIYPLQVGYDRYSSQYLVNAMKNYGFHMDDVFQGENLTPVIREAEGIIRDGRLRIGNNNLLKAHFMNSALKANAETRRVKLVKVDRRCHVDGMAAVLDALTVRQKYSGEIGEQLKNKTRWK